MQFMLPWLEHFHRFLELIAETSNAVDTAPSLGSGLSYHQRSFAGIYQSISYLPCANSTIRATLPQTSLSMQIESLRKIIPKN